MISAPEPSARRLVRRVRPWLLLACLVAAGFACSQALADDPPGAQTEPTPTEPPPAAATGPVTTVSSPQPAPVAAPKPDLPPVQRRKAPVRRPAPAATPKPAPVQSATQAPPRVAVRPSAPAPVRETPRRVAPTEVRTQDPVAPRRTAQKRAKLTGSWAATKNKPAPSPRPVPKALPTPAKSKPAGKVLEALTRGVAAIPSPPQAGSDSPAAIESGGSSLRWLVIALMGTGAVFLTAMGSRRVLEFRARGDVVEAPGPPLPRVTTPLPPPQPVTRPGRNGSSAPEPAAGSPVTSRPLRGKAPSDEIEISWARGYFKSDFYLATVEADGEVFEVARSPAFRWTAEEDPPRAEAITAAHAALVEQLAALGWEEVGSGESWYAGRYRRPADVETIRT